MKRMGWLKYYLGAFLIAPFIFKGIQVELGPFTTNRLCSACHTMEAVSEEYYKAKHFNNPSGVKPGCVDCHLTDGLVSLSGAGLIVKDAVIEIFNPARTGKEFEERRARLAEVVRKELLGSDSANCRKCHIMDAIVPTRDRGKNAHEDSIKTGETCIECHYNLVHAEVPWEKPKKERGDELEGEVKPAEEEL